MGRAAACYLLFWYTLQGSAKTAERQLGPSCLGEIHLQGPGLLIVSSPLPPGEFSRLISVYATRPCKTIIISVRADQTCPRDGFSCEGAWNSVASRKTPDISLLCTVLLPNGKPRGKWCLWVFEVKIMLYDVSYPELENEPVQSLCEPGSSGFKATASEHKGPRLSHSLMRNRRVMSIFSYKSSLSN